MLCRRLSGWALFGALVFLSAWACAEKLDPRLRLIRGASPQQRHRLRRHLAVDTSKAAHAVELFIHAAPGVNMRELEAAHPGVKFRGQAGRIITARVPLDKLGALEADVRVRRLQAGRKLAPTLDVVRSNQTNPLTGYFMGVLQNNTDLDAFDGTGVVVGVVDSGIDVNHADFKNGGTSRILYLLDQTTSADYDIRTNGLGGVTETDTQGHGSHVAGIAAGNGGGTTLMGIARNADIIAVKTTFDDTDVVAGMNYIISRAAALGKRAVINLSLGGQGGAHDGTDTFDQNIAAIAASTPVVVAAGNDASDRPHASFTVPASGARTPVVETTTPGGGAATEFIDTEFWYPGADDYSVTVTLNGGPGGSVTRAAGVDADPPVTVGGGANTATVQILHGDNTPSGTDKQIFIEVDVAGTATMPTSITYTLTRTANGGSGQVDGYTQPAILGTSFSAAWGVSTGTLTSPGTADNVFTVGSYTSKNTWVRSDGQSISYNGSPTLGAISSFSGTGPRRNGTLKPEITAPGHGVGSTYSAQQSPAAPANNVLIGGTHKIDQGTSMATPVVAGFLALKLQVSPAITVADLRSEFASYTRQDNAVGVTFPNNTWGYGKLMVNLKPTSLVTGISGQALGTSSARFTWSGHREATSYHVYYASATGQLAGSISGTTIDLVGVPANTVTGVFLKPANAAGEGPGAPNVTVRTLSNPVSGVSVIAHVSSMTVTFTPCPASPGDQSCSGYQLDAAVASDFSGTVFSSVTANRASVSLQIPGLAAQTNYYLRIASLNGAGAPNYSSLGPTATINPIGTAGASGFSSVAATSLRVSWLRNGNPTSTNYSVDLSTDANFTGVLANQQGVDLLTALYTGLIPNTSYYARVQAVGGGAPLVQGPQATLIADPTALGQPYSNVSATGLTFSWGAAANAVDTPYLAQISPASDFSSNVLSSTTFNPFAGFASGLSSNTTYYARVQATARLGTLTAMLTAGATSTLALVPTLPAVSNQTPTGFTGSFNNGGNRAGTVYVAVISASPTLSPAAASVTTTNTSATFTGLTPNVTYYFSAAAINNSGGATAFAAAVSTNTLPAVPISASVTSSNQTTTALRASWNGANNGAGTRFLAQFSADPSFSIVATSDTANTYVDYTVLSPNTSYYLRVKARGYGTPANPDSSFATVGSPATLANPPTAAPPTYLYVGESSATIQWTPVAGGAAQAYAIQAAVDPSFNGPLFISTVTGGSTSRGTVLGLAANQTYFFRVGSLNFDGAANFVTLASSKTMTTFANTGTVGSNGLSLVGFSRKAEINSVTVSAPPGAFPAGTNVTLNAAVEALLPPPTFTEGRATPLADGLGLQLDAGGLQPTAAITIMMSFNPAKLPIGANVSQVRLARYDQSAGSWTLQPSFVSGSTVVAQVNHFSLFAPFVVQAGSDLSDVVIFPIPWKPGSTDANFNALQLTVSNLPANAGVKIYTIVGEKLVSGSAGADGVYSWKGDNSRGGLVGSGTYLLVIDSGGRSVTRRVVVIR